MGTDAIFPGTPPVNQPLILDNGHGTTAQTLYTVPSGASDKGVLMGRLRASSDDTSAVTLQFSALVGASEVILGESQVPAGAGTNGATAWKDVLADINASLPLDLAPSTVLKVKAKAAITSGKYVHLWMSGAPLA